MADIALDPPSGVGTKLDPTPRLEFLRGVEETEIALRDEVFQVCPPVHVGAGDFDYQPQVRLNKVVAGFLIPGRYLDG
jgi:hypothetical protein